MSGKTFRASVSVGTRDARVGLRGVRSFISKNRNQAYPCLYDIMRICRYGFSVHMTVRTLTYSSFSPIKELIIVFFWFSHLYHNNTCKVTRGKHSINAF